MIDSAIAYLFVTPDRLQSRTILQTERHTNRCARTQTRIGFISLSLPSFLTCHTASTTMLTTCPPPDLPFRAPVGLCSLANHVARIRYQRAVAFIDGQNPFEHPKTHSVSIIPTAILPDSPRPAVLKRNGPTIKSSSLLQAFRSPDQFWHAYWTRRLMTTRCAGVHETLRPVRYQYETLSLPDCPVGGPLPIGLRRWPRDPESMAVGPDESRQRVVDLANHTADNSKKIMLTSVE